MTETPLLRTRAAIKSFQASKTSEERQTTASQPPSEGKYGPYYQPVEEPFEMKRIVAESISLEGGVAAVLLQIAHLPVGKGVARHSSFTYRRVERGRRTVNYIYCMTFGTPEEKRLITDATHKAHAHIKGDGYDANDVDAQLWVAATIYWTIVKSYELVFGKLDAERAERVYKEFSVMATALRVPPEKWPQDLTAFQIYWDDMISNLVVTDEARAVAKDVLEQKGLPWGFAWLYLTLKAPVSRAMTIEMLPENVRNDFGLPSTPYTRQLFKLTTNFNANVIPYLPASVREWPKNYFLADLRRRISTGSRL